MSQENVEIVRRVWRAFTSRDFDGMLDACADDLVLRLVGGLSDMVGEEFKGVEGFRRFVEDWYENLGADAEVEAAYDLGDRVLTIVLLHTIGGASGTPVTIRSGQLYTFRDGLITQIESYYDPATALEAAGLSE